MSKYLENIVYQFFRQLETAVFSPFKLIEINEPQRLELPGLFKDFPRIKDKKVTD